MTPLQEKVLRWGAIAFLFVIALWVLLIFGLYIWHNFENPEVINDVAARLGYGMIVAGSILIVRKFLFTIF